MLQNFQDLEQASPSKARLWLFLARDLAVSLRSQFTKSLWGQTAIVVIVLAVLLAFTEHHVAARRHLTEAFCFCYILGWFAGWFGSRWQASIGRVPSHIRSLPAQAVIALVFVIGVAAGAGAQNHVIWILCYGFLLAWIAGWVGNRRQRLS